MYKKNGEILHILLNAGLLAATLLYLAACLHLI